MPGFLAGCLVDRGRGLGGVVLADATTGLAPAALLAELFDEVEHCEPSLAAPWTPAGPVPAELTGVPGTWHWGGTPVEFGVEGDELVARRGGRELYRFGVSGGRVTGRAGYNAGEELTVVRRVDGSVVRLEAATFVYTRDPYGPHH